MRCVPCRQQVHPFQQCNLVSPAFVFSEMGAEKMQSHTRWPTTAHVLHLQCKWELALYSFASCWCECLWSVRFSSSSNIPDLPSCRPDVNCIQPQDCMFLPRTRRDWLSETTVNAMAPAQPGSTFHRKNQFPTWCVANATLCLCFSVPINCSKDVWFVWQNGKSFISEKKKRSFVWRRHEEHWAS